MKTTALERLFGKEPRLRENYIPPKEVVRNQIVGVEMLPCGGLITVQKHGGGEEVVLHLANRFGVWRLGVVGSGPSSSTARQDERAVGRAVSGLCARILSAGTVVGISKEGEVWEATREGLNLERQVVVLYPEIFAAGGFLGCPWGEGGPSFEALNPEREKMFARLQAVLAAAREKRGICTVIAPNLGGLLRGNEATGPPAKPPIGFGGTGSFARMVVTKVAVPFLGAGLPYFDLVCVLSGRKRWGLSAEGIAACGPNLGVGRLEEIVAEVARSLLSLKKTGKEALPISRSVLDAIHQASMDLLAQIAGLKVRIEHQGFGDKLVEYAVRRDLTDKWYLLGPEEVNAETAEGGIEWPSQTWDQLPGREISVGEVGLRPSPSKLAFHLGGILQRAGYPKIEISPQSLKFWVVEQYPAGGERIDAATIQVDSDPAWRDLVEQVVGLLGGDDQQLGGGEVRVRVFGMIPLCIQEGGRAERRRVVVGEVKGGGKEGPFALVVDRLRLPPQED